MPMGRAPKQNQTRNVVKAQFKTDEELLTSFIMMVMQRMVMAMMTIMLSLMSISDDEDVKMIMIMM